MDHPHIVRLNQVFDSQNCLYMVMELCTGGELFDRIVMKVISYSLFDELLFFVTHDKAGSNSWGFVPNLKLPDLEILLGGVTVIIQHPRTSIWEYFRTSREF